MTNIIKKFQHVFYQKALVNILVFGIITTIVYGILIKNLDNRIVREIDDKAFDLISNSWSFVDTSIKEKIKIFKVDDAFLKSEKLMDDTNKTTKHYGEFIPKRYITEFIDKLDKRKPKLLFIDYIIDSPHMSIWDIEKLNKEELIRVIEEEQAFINKLNEKRSYPIYLLHHKNYNYIEEKVYNKNVKFVSAMHSKESSILRRYQSYIERKNAQGKLQKYYYAPFHFLDLNLSQFNKADKIIGNRILYQIDEKTKNIKWNTIKSFSLKRDLDKFKNGYIDYEMVFLGEAHSDSLDKHTLFTGKKEFGIDIIANSVMSTIYFGSQLKLLPLIPSLIIIFIIAVIARILSLLLGNKIGSFFKKIINLNHKIIIAISVFLFVIFLFVISAFVSWLFLVYGKVWFSCSIGYVMFKIIMLLF